MWNEYLIHTGVGLNRPICMTAITATQLVGRKINQNPTSGQTQAIFQEGRFSEIVPCNVLALCHNPPITKYTQNVIQLTYYLPCIKY